VLAEVWLVERVVGISSLLSGAALAVFYWYAEEKEDDNEHDENQKLLKQIVDNTRAIPYLIPQDKPSPILEAIRTQTVEQAMQYAREQGLVQEKAEEVEGGDDLPAMPGRMKPQQSYSIDTLDIEHQVPL